MQHNTRLALNAAAWFFVGQSDTTGAPKNVPIETPFRIGRNPNSDLCLPCHSVSGLHAIIVEQDNGLWLMDQNSTNGTFLNGNRINTNCLLSENDTVQFGTTVFQITRVDEDNESLNGESEGDLTAMRESHELERLFAGGVVPFFQPIMKINNGEQEVVGYEVLGRSRLFGLRTPAQMFAAASRMEMEAELSRVLRKQGLQVASNNLPENYSLFVNTHPAELECRGLQVSLQQIREDHPERSIVLEVHESVLNDEIKLKALQGNLKQQEIKLAFHEFGGGQIAMARLCEASPDIVKFDVKLIQGIDKAPAKRQKFVEAMVRLVTDLGITPMAECIEEPDEHEALRQMGFALGQGFHYGRPSPISECLTNKDSMPNVPLVKSFLDGSSQPNTAGKSNGPKSADWLLEQPEHYYTIQVLSAISKERANEHIAMQESPEQFAIFCKQGKTRMLYIVVCGAFEDRAAAKAASAELANASVSPWIRMLSSVHAEIRSGQK